MIVYTSTEIPFRRMQPEDDRLIPRTIAFLRREFSIRHPDHRTTPYIIAQRRNAERQVLEIRMCAPASEVLKRIAQTGDTSWSIEQFVETP